MNTTLGDSSPIVDSQLAALVLTIVNIFISAATPILIIALKLIKNIKHCRICAGHISTCCDSDCMPVPEQVNPEIDIRKSVPDNIKNLNALI